ncbi:hypothetical protein [Arthrobacter roseus]|uniref:hypothetical protein n=1 Tax=Arthrobacter roseus TaxID=136274 RepID=UPI0019642F2D|nr:hypothetical protein [Arthrobacter roseus]MBM7848881.1 hypothetical protein [Arthrobacter roseus]
MVTSYFEELLEEAISCADESESARVAMMNASRRRQEAIFSLHMEGLPIRQVATHIGVSPAVVQAAVKAAKLRRHHLRRREERIPYELHVELSRKLRSDEQNLRSIGLRNLDLMQQRQRNPLAQQWINDWRELLNATLETLDSRMLADDANAVEMRQMSPFAGALSEVERLAAIRRATALA